MNRLIQKSLASMALVCVVLTSLIPAASAATVTTSDIADHWAEPVLTRWLKEGLIKGYEDGSFRPNDVITRAEAASLINRKFDITDAVEGKTFKDLASDTWQYGPLTAAVEAGYIKGYDDGTIQPDGVLTRQELAVVINDLLGLEANKEEVSFVDAVKIPQWSKHDIAAVAASQIMDGYTDGTFAPTRTVTRAEAVVTLDRAASFLNKKGPVVYSTAGVYGPEQGKETVYQDVTISRQGVTLRNMTIYGDLLLGEGIGEGDVTLQNVTVHGQTTVNGGGANSIHFENSTLITIIIEKKNGEVRIVATGTTSVQMVDVRSSVTIQEERASGSGFMGIVLNSKLGDGTEVKLDGDFDTVQVDSKGTKFQLVKGTIIELGVAKDAAGNEISLGEKGTVKQLIVFAVIQVKGQGTIEKARVNEGAEATTFEKMPKTVNDKSPVVPGAGGGGVPQTSTPENISMKVTASGYKKLDVSFSGAVDPATTTIRVQNTENTIGDVQYSSDHKRATVVMNEALSKGSYTIVVTSNKTGGVKTISQDVEVEDERVVSLAYAHDSAIWNANTPDSIKLKYKLTNQYGEDATARYGNKVMASFSPVIPLGISYSHPESGWVALTNYRPLAENDKLSVYAFYGDDSGEYLTLKKELIVSRSELPATSPGSPFTILFEMGGLYHPDNKELKVNSNLDEFSILFRWKGETELVSKNFIAVSSNNDVGVKQNEQGPVFGTVKIGDKEYSSLTLTRGNVTQALHAGIYYIHLVDKYTGYVVPILITVNPDTSARPEAEAVFIIGDTLLAKYDAAGDYTAANWSLQGSVTSTVYHTQYINTTEYMGRFMIQGDLIPSDMYTADSNLNNQPKHIQALMLGTETVNGAVYGKIYYGGNNVKAKINNIDLDLATPSHNLPLLTNDVIRITYGDQVTLSAIWIGTKWVFTIMTLYVPPTVPPVVPPGQLIN